MLLTAGRRSIVVTGPAASRPMASAEDTVWRRMIATPPGLVDRLTIKNLSSNWAAPEPSGNDPETQSIVFRVPQIDMRPYRA